MFATLAARLSAHSRTCALLRARSYVPFAAAFAMVAAAHAQQAPKPEFNVTPEQIRALGVTLQKLTAPGAAAGLGYPARVVLPPNREYVVSAPLDGSVDQVLVNAQDAIRAGQPLLRLASPQYSDLQLKLMEASTRASLSQKTLARERALFSEGIVPERRVQEAEAVAASDGARLKQARAELRLAGADPGALERGGASGRMDEALMLRARQGGVVLGLEVKPGQRVRQADPLMRLADLSELWLEVQMPLDRPAPRSGELRVVGREVVAVPISVAAQAGDSQTVTLRARITRGAAQLRPGETVQAQVPADAVAGWVLPLGALARHGNGTYVFVRTSSGFTSTPVEVLASAASSVQLRGNLRAGQEVAVGAVVALKSAWLGIGGVQ